MKKIALAGTVLALALSAGSAFAGPTAGSIGLNVDLGYSSSPLGGPANFLVKGKYLVKQDLAILAGVGLQMADSGAPTNATSTNLGLMGGIRKYMKTDDFAPFFGGRLQYVSTRDNTFNDDVTDLTLLAEFGAEYFFAKQFSLEGAVAAGYASQKREPVGGTTSTTETAIGTATYSVSANFYF
jgi:hypothetical protein